MVGFPPDGAYSCQRQGQQSNPGTLMSSRSLLMLALLLALAAAAPAPSEDEMVKQCRGELETRLFGDSPHGEAFITAQDVQHQPDRIVVRLDLASGEGRRIAGSCIFREGKLFDVK
jgi:hypothetical protein